MSEPTQEPDEPGPDRWSRGARLSFLILGGMAAWLLLILGAWLVWPARR